MKLIEIMINKMTESIEQDVNVYNVSCQFTISKMCRQKHFFIKDIDAARLLFAT